MIHSAIPRSGRLAMPVGIYPWRTFVALLATALVAGCHTGLHSATPVGKLVSPTSLQVAGTVESSNPPAAGYPPSPPVAYTWEPSHHRRWQKDLAVLPVAEFEADRVTVRNIRNCDYITEHDYLVNYHDETFDLDQLESVYFFVSPFDEVPAIAHTMLSFGLDDGRYIGVSVEVRLEEGEQYTPLRGALRQFEIMYVVADERDMIPLRTEHRKAQVYMYRARASQKQVRDLFVDMMRRVNEIYRQPEFYETLTNNCTTNIVDHINRLAPGRIPNDYRVLLPGYSAELAYELGLLDTDLSFEETRRRANINALVREFKDSPDFSAKIRGK